MKSSSSEAVARLIRESQVPLLLVRRPLPVPDKPPPPPVRVPSALWTRRISPSPIDEGIGEP